MFLNFQDLKKLKLSSCSIQTIDPKAFSHLLNLNELDISHNENLTKLHIEDLLKIRVLNADECGNLAMVKLLDSSSTSALDELLLPIGREITLEGPSRLFCHTRYLASTPICNVSFNTFAGLERLTLAIQTIDDIKPGQLSSLVCLKELNLEGTLFIWDYGLKFTFLIFYVFLAIVKLNQFC
jgi:hypothetical protein